MMSHLVSYFVSPVIKSDFDSSVHKGDFYRRNKFYFGKFTTHTHTHTKNCTTVRYNDKEREHSSTGIQTTTGHTKDVSLKTETNCCNRCLSVIQITIMIYTPILYTSLNIFNHFIIPYFNCVIAQPCYNYALFCILFANWHSPATLTEGFPCFFLSCKANGRV